jgi:hypothetical protein
MSRGARVGLSLLGTVLVLGVAGVLWFVAVLSGGFDDLFDVSHPKESSSEVRAARERGSARLEVDTVAFVAQAGAATGLRHRQGVESRADFCDEGQHNWKTDTDYDLLCTAERRVLLLGVAADAQAQVGALAAWLDGQGYHPAYGEGVRFTRDPGAAVDDGDLGQAVTYVGPGSRRLEVELLAHDSPLYRLAFLGDPRRPLTVDGSVVDDSFAPSRLVGPDAFGVLVTLSVTSFED